MDTVIESVLRLLFLLGGLLIPLAVAIILVFYPLVKIQFSKKNPLLNIGMKVIYVFAIDSILYLSYILYEREVESLHKFLSTYIKAVYFLYFMFSILFLSLFMIPEMKKIFIKKENENKTEV